MPDRAILHLEELAASWCRLLSKNLTVKIMSRLMTVPLELAADFFLIKHVLILIVN